MEYDFYDIIQCLSEDIRERVLIEASSSENPGIREAVAKNSYTPSEILTRLAGDKYWQVRSAVAYNSNTLADVLTLLAQDDNGCVRINVAKNLNTPTEVWLN